MATSATSTPVAPTAAIDATGSGTVQQHPRVVDERRPRPPGHPGRAGRAEDAEPVGDRTGENRREQHPDHPPALTERGWEALDLGERVIADYDTWLATAVGVDQVAALRETLRRIIATPRRE